MPNPTGMAREIRSPRSRDRSTRAVLGFDGFFGLAVLGGFLNWLKVSSLRLKIQTFEGLGPLGASRPSISAANLGTLCRFRAEASRL